MVNLILLLHVVIAVIIIALILLQQGKGAEMGASFGSGASQTLFGASGSGNFFSRATAWLAAAFFVTSFSLAVMAKQGTEIEDDMPTLIEESIPAIEESDSDSIPDLEGATSAVDDDVPPSLEEASVSEAVAAPGETSLDETSVSEELQETTPVE